MAYRGFNCKVLASDPVTCAYLAQTVYGTRDELKVSLTYKSVNNLTTKSK